MTSTYGVISHHKRTLIKDLAITERSLRIETDQEVLAQLSQDIHTLLEEINNCDIALEAINATA